MGCSASTDAGSQTYDRRPKISVRVQAEARKLDAKPLIIFVFGGPGSHKGRVVDDLTTSYGFQFISGESVIFDEFPKYVGHEGGTDTTKGLKEATNDHPNKLTLDWLLGAIGKRIENSKGCDKFIIDIMPNLKYFIRLPGLSKDCRTAMAEFEQKFQVCFALNLAVPADKILKNKQVVCVDPAKSSKLAKDGQNDEADSSRTQKRAALFSETAKTYLDYFTASERLVTVDVSGGIADNIWYRVHELLYNMDFVPDRTVNTVIVFTMTEEDADAIDVNKYLMEPVLLSSIATNPAGSLDGLAKDLSVHVDKYSREFDAFLVKCQGTSIPAQAGSSKKKSRDILFMDIGEGYLESYLPGSPKSYRPPPNARRYRAVSSSENEICLFPMDTPPDLCTHLSALLARQRVV